MPANYARALFALHVVGRITFRMLVVHDKHLQGSCTPNMTNLDTICALKDHGKWKVIRERNGFSVLAWKVIEPFSANDQFSVKRSVLTLERGNDRLRMNRLGQR